MRYDCLVSSLAQEGVKLTRGWGQVGGEWRGGGGLFCAHPLVDFTPSCARLDTKQSYLIEFSTVSDHLFVRISSVGSL